MTSANPLRRSTLSIFLKMYWEGDPIEDDLLYEFLTHIKRNTQFKHEILKINKKSPAKTVIPENAFTIFFKTFIEGHEERLVSEKNKIQLNQEILFPLQ